MSKVSIIIPTFNSEKYLSVAITSVLDQSYNNLELLVINDGSTDKSRELILSFGDKRIRYFEQENKGVSEARNVGLKNMTGDFFLFLDADDALTTNSISERLNFYSDHSEYDFIDGPVQKTDHELKSVSSVWYPNFTGNPLRDLIKLTGRSFFGPSWLIKRRAGIEYKFDTNITHGEELMFYMGLSRLGGQYSYVDYPILKYRNTPGSAMKNLHGLESGYLYIDKVISTWPEIDKRALQSYRYRYKRAMVLAYLRSGMYKSAFRTLFDNAKR